MIIESLKYSISSLWNRKLRSFLTILSILIGIAAIFALISFGEGLNRYVNDFAEEIGTNKVMMMPGGFLAPGTSNSLFTDDELDFIKGINGVDLATGWMTTQSKVKFRDYKEKYTLIFGFSAEPDEQRLTEEIATVDIKEGRNLKKGDILKALLGYNYLVADKLFKKAIKVGDKIKINNREVEVVGFYEQIGNPQDDSQVYLTFEGMEEIFGQKDYEYIGIRSSSGEEPSKLAARIKERFRKHRGQKKGEEDFSVQTFEDMMKAFTNVVTILNGVLVLISVISIVVAAVNIANTMYTSVLERTKEIGLMKAIGSRNSQILNTFIIESGALGLIGGISGVLAGYGIAKAGGLIAKSAGLAMLSPVFPLWLIIGCLAFASLVGAGSGLLPAIRASKQKPVDALRYE